MITTRPFRRPVDPTRAAPASAEAWMRSPLVVAAAAMAVLAAAFAVGIFADPRTIAGQPAWLKPFKFGVSISVYLLTIAWMLSFLRSGGVWLRRFATAFTWTAIAVFSAEMAAIVVQVARSTTSHFNVATSFDAGVWAVMAVAILALWVANFALAAVLAFRPFASPVTAWSVRLGVAIAVIGMGQAFLMTSPTAQQLAGWRDGGAVSVVGAHSVGAPDGGAGLPVTGWRTDAGDLRVGHFVGIHGLQAIPFVGWIVGRRRRLDARRKVLLVWLAAAAYLGLTALLTWQALRAQPLLQPDALTLGALAALAAATAVACAAILRGQGAARAQSGR